MRTGRRCARGKPQRGLGELSQAQTDAIVDAMARAAVEHAEALARAAVDETGYGVAADKVQKNLFAARNVHAFIRPMATVGVIARHEDRRVVDIAEPFGPIAAIVPSTNPTSTAIYKLLIALKARCAIVLSPHPAAQGCITRTAELLAAAAREAGAPDGAISWLTTVTVAGTQALMRRREIAVILATGGLGLVRAAYSAGKPAYGVGPGNAPAYIEQSADVAKAVRDIVTGKSFDNGLLCSSENAVVVGRGDRRGGTAGVPHRRRSLSEPGGARGGGGRPRYPAAAAASRSRRTFGGRGRTPRRNRRTAGDARAHRAARRRRPQTSALDREASVPFWPSTRSPTGARAANGARSSLGYGGMGHTMAIHSRNDAVILEFGLKKPAFRIVVNSPTTHGSIGLTTGLDPALTLGCGGLGGNITSDNISPKHLLNLKRLAYEVRPAVTRGAAPAVPSGQAAPTRAAGSPVLDPSALVERIDGFLGTGAATASGGSESGAGAAKEEPAAASPPEPATFVCEADVRGALGAGRPIRIDRRTIVTPAARDLAAGREILLEADTGTG